MKKKDKNKGKKRVSLSVILDRGKAQFKDEIRELRKLSALKYLLFFTLFIFLGMIVALYNHNWALQLEELEEYQFQSTSSETYYSQFELDEEEGFAYRPEEGDALKDYTKGEIFEEDEALEVVSKVSSSNDLIQFISPVDGTVVKSWREPYKDRILDAWKFNSGVDLRADVGTKVRAAQSGYVEELISDDYRGITVMIKHNDTFKTLYRNLSSSYLDVNEEVSKGQSIGEVGDSGRNEENVLRFEVLKFDGNYYENRSPMDYLK